MTPDIEKATEWKHDPDRLRGYLRKHHVSASQAAILVGVDARTVRRWTSARRDPTARAMPYAAWVAMRYWVEDGDGLDGLEDL